LTYTYVYHKSLPKRLAAHVPNTAAFDCASIVPTFVYVVWCCSTRCSADIRIGRRVAMGRDNPLSRGSSDFLCGLFDARWEVIDGHAHFYSYNYFRLLSQVPGQHGDVEQYMRQQARRLKIDLPPIDPGRLAQRWVAEMDRYGISRMCLLAGLPGDEYSITEGLRAYPDRFIGFVDVNPHLVIAEDVLEHAVRGGGVKGVCLHPCRHRFHASDELVYPIYTLARRHRLTVYVNYGPPSCPVATRWGAQDNHDPRFNDPAQLHFAASDFPTVPFVIAHFLEKHLPEMLRLALLCPNVHICTSPADVCDEEPDTGKNIEPQLTMMLKAFGYKRILFGTGSGIFPRGWRSDMFRSLLAALKNLGLPNEVVGMILGGNLKRLFRLDDSRLTYLITL